MALKYYLDRKDPVRRAQKGRLLKMARKSNLKMTEFQINESIDESAVTRSDSISRPMMTETKTKARTRTRTNTKARTLRPVGVKSGQRRRPLTQDQKNIVLTRDHGRCTHIDANGNRCNQDRWIHIHHLKPVSQGGSNEPENLTTLCSFHHDLAHQLTLPLEGQITWLRSPQSKYG